MSGDEEFFGSEVEFVRTGDGLVETEHPALGGQPWILRTAVGLISGAVLMLSAPSYATEARVIPLDVAIAQRSHERDVARTASQGLTDLFGHADQLLSDLRQRRQSGGPGLRAETSKRFSSSVASTGEDNEAHEAAINFVLNAK